MNHILHGFTYENASSANIKHDITATATIDEIAYFAVGLGCALIGIELGTKVNGEYTG